MPIDGMDDDLRYQRIAKVRYGTKKTSERTGKEYPVFLDHFICDDPAFNERMGDAPKVIHIVFPWNTIELCFPHHRMWYATSGLKCKGNGKTAVQYLDDGTTAECICEGKECPNSVSKPAKCKPTGYLRYFIPDVSMSGYYQTDTHSYNSIVNINSALVLAQRRFNGRLMGIPFVLELHMQEVNAEGKKKEVPIMMLLVDEKALRDNPELVEFAQKPALSAGRDASAEEFPGEEPEEESVVDENEPVKSDLLENAYGDKARVRTFAEIKDAIRTASSAGALNGLVAEYNELYLDGKITLAEANTLKAEYKQRQKAL